jgi:hypothetical protein
LIQPGTHYLFHMILLSSILSQTTAVHVSILRSVMLLAKHGLFFPYFQTSHIRYARYMSYSSHFSYNNIWREVHANVLLGLWAYSHWGCIFPLPTVGLYLQERVMHTVLTDVHDVLHHDVGSVLGSHCPCLQARKPALHHCTDTRMWGTLVNVAPRAVTWKRLCILPTESEIVSIYDGKSLLPTRQELTSESPRYWTLSIVRCSENWKETPCWKLGLLPSSGEDIETTPLLGPFNINKHLRPVHVEGR